jgi:hypothetical protein
LVISYAYLWHSEHLRGRQEGIKARPCAIVLTSAASKGGLAVAVVPITHSLPAGFDEAVEIPRATKRRLGLDDASSWAIVNEVNLFLWPGSDLCPVSRDEPGKYDYGFLPPALFRQIKERLLACARTQRLTGVNRSD